MPAQIPDRMNRVIIHPVNFNVKGHSYSFYTIDVELSNPYPCCKMRVAVSTDALWFILLIALEFSEWAKYSTGKTVLKLIWGNVV